LVVAGEPDAPPHCRLTPENGSRRAANTDGLFARLADQRKTSGGQEFVFRGDPDELWTQVSLFVDEEAQCCPFFTFEQIEQADGVLLRLTGKAVQ
jgi:hypothetical protein